MSLPLAAVATGDPTTDTLTPFSEGYRWLLALVLVNMGTHLVSAPLARFIVMNRSWF